MKIWYQISMSRIAQDHARERATSPAYAVESADEPDFDARETDVWGERNAAAMAAAMRAVGADPATLDDLGLRLDRRTQISRFGEAIVDGLTRDKREAVLILCVLVVVLAVLAVTIGPRIVAMWGGVHV